MAHVVDEVLQAKELDGAQGAPVAPVHVDLELAGLVQVEAEPEPAQERFLSFRGRK